MAAVWGEAEIEVHIDGKALPAEMRRATTQAAIVGGKAFESRFKAMLRRVAANVAKDFGRNLGDLIATAFLSSGALRGVYRATITLRQGFRRLGSTISNFAKSAFSRIVTGFREFGDLVRTDSVKTMDMLRDGFAKLKISMDDVEQTFPPVFKAVRAIGSAFRSVSDEVRGFGNLVRTDAIRTMDTLREGASHLKIDLVDLQETFPGLTKAVTKTRDGFVAAGRGIRRFGLAVKSLGPDMEDVAPVAERLGDSFRRLFNVFINGRAGLQGTREGLAKVTVALDEVRKSSDEAAESSEDANERIGRGSTRASTRSVNAVRKILSAWKRMPHGFRQAVFWIGLVSAAMGGLSVLGSALSGTIVALITQITALGVGAGIAAVGFAGLFKENANLAEGATKSLAAFKELGSTFGDLQEQITNRMFSGMENSIKSLTKTLLPALNDEILAFADTAGAAVNKVFFAFSSDKGIANFSALLTGLQPIFTSLVDAAISFGTALADILIASLPTAQLFAQAIADVGARFAEWTNSEAGRARLAEFFATAQTIMPLVVDLFVALGGAIAGLVTPTTIAGFQQVLQSLINFTPILGGIIGVLANLNIFGVIAAALDAVGAALAPLIPPLQEMARVVGEQLVAGFEMLKGPLADLGTALAPVIGFLSELLNVILPPLFVIIGGGVSVIAAIVDIFVALGEAIFGTGENTTEFGDTVITVFSAIGTAFNIWNSLLVGGLKAIAALLRGDTAGAFKILQGVADSVFKAMGTSTEDVVAAVANLFMNVQKFFGKIGTELSNFGRDVAKVFGGVVGWIKDAIGWLGSLFGAASNASSAVSSARGNAGRATPTAAGALLTSPRRILAGEAGPEAIVPLRRNLSQVDPSVRWLSAIAQGITPMASGGIVGGGRTLNVHEGAIQIIGSPDPERTSLSVVNRLIERAV